MYRGRDMNIAQMNGNVPGNIERIIDEKCLKKSSIAKKAGMKPQEFTDMLNGRKLIKVKDIMTLAQALQVDMNELFRTE